MMVVLKRVSVVLAVLAVAGIASAAVALGAAPSATTGAATGVTDTASTLHGTVDPQGQATTYLFEYGTTSAYGSTTPSASAGSGTGPSDVTASLSGLTAQTTYHYRLVASSSQGTTNGADSTFTTSRDPAPAVTTQPATAVTTSSARLNGSVGPQGENTTYHFEYGPTSSYGSRTAEASAGHGTGSTNVSAVVKGLAPGTTYHVRIVATNAGG